MSVFDIPGFEIVFFSFQPQKVNFASVEEEELQIANATDNYGPHEMRPKLFFNNIMDKNKLSCFSMAFGIDVPLRWIPV